MEEVEVITLENGIEYVILDEIKSGNTKYVYLANENDEKDICIRKVVVKDGEEFLTTLDSQKETDMALLIFAKNHIKD